MYQQRIKRLFFSLFKKKETKRIITPCPSLKCIGELVLRKNSFYSCSEYPDCKATMSLNDFNTYTKRNKTKRVYMPHALDIPRHLVVVDFETTGLNPSTDKIIEVGAIKYSNGKEIERFTELINIDGDLPRNITDITGITKDMLSSSRNEKQVLESLRSFIGDTQLIVAHNAEFDLLFLGYSLKRLKLKPWSGNVICTYKTSRILYPCNNKGEAISHKLNDLCRNLKISTQSNHRAINDAEATYKILVSMWSKVQQFGVKPELHVSDLVRKKALQVNYFEVKL